MKNCETGIVKTEISLDKMWETIEQYGLKRDMLEKINPTHNDISEIYQLIKKNRDRIRDYETVKRLQEYIKQKNTPRTSGLNTCDPTSLNHNLTKCL